MPTVELRGIRNFVCQGTNLEVPCGEMLVLLGPNGAGKTTLLNVIAGLVWYEGKVSFDGVAVDALAARERNVGYVFQDLVLFPHLDVGSNVAYGLHAIGWSKHRVRARVSELLDLLKISHLASRYPATLSGGEKQRVALARALASYPEILLLDEPFSSLDRQTSGFMRGELKNLQRRLGTTTVFVTHDLTEAEEISDRIAVVKDGRVDKVGKPAEVLFPPQGPEAAECIGAANLLSCESSRRLGHGLVEVACNGFQVVVPHNGAALRTIAILPRDIQVSPHRPASEVNTFAGSVLELSMVPGAARVTVEIGGCQLTAELPTELLETMHLKPGDDVFLNLGLMNIRTSSAPTSCV